MASIGERTYRGGTTSFRVQFRVNGRVTQESFVTREGAEEFKGLVDRFGGSTARRILAARQAATTAAPTLREFTHRYLDPASGMLTGITEGTRAGYVRSAELSFLPMLGELPVDAIEREDIGRWVSWQEQQPSARRIGELVAAKTVKNYHALLSSVLTAAISAKHRTDNPAYKVALTTGQKTRESVFLSPDEFRTLLHFIHPHYQRLVLLLAGTGLRWGEATALTWGDLNLWSTPPTLRVDKAWKKGPAGKMVLGPPKTPKARRTVSMPLSLVDMLGEPEDGDILVFRGPQSGQRIWYQRFRESYWNTAVEKAMDKDACKSLGMTPLTRRPTPHDLRHTHASWLIAAGKPLPYIQARLGHEKITTTIDVYGHLVPDAHQQMADAIDTTLGLVRAEEITTAEVVDEMLILEATPLPEA